MQNNLQRIKKEGSKIYGKHFQSTYTGSMVGAGPVIFALWGYVIANVRDSIVELNPTIIAAIIGCQIAEIEAAIDELCAPDTKSRTKDHEGRRLIKQSEFAYFVPTYEKYHNIRNENERREYMRNYMRDYRKKESVNVYVNSGKPQLAHTDSDTDTIKHKSKSDDLNFSIFWELYPRKENKKKSETSWNRLTVTKKKAALAHLRKRPYDLTKKQFIPLPTTYINGERWEDADKEPKPYGHGAI